jgi:hypothetical protein
VPCTLCPAPAVHLSSKLPRASVMRSLRDPKLGIINPTKLGMEGDDDPCQTAPAQPRAKEHALAGHEVAFPHEP